AAFDRDGALAARGRVDAALLARLRADPWFALPPPKSTGREQFHLDWALSAPAAAGAAAADIQATLLALTVATVGEALLRHQPGTRRVL
ncbi:anhydro-N-acetylmuramic acid kinase, partial [Bacillus sp. SIMBA_005]|uniref:anhydro-N-acetylmuramic acid kinase n=1 Tax=Bacillus sp. SIMBA_005 TaxID=3085754 RepID=UPI00397D56FB